MILQEYKKGKEIIRIIQDPEPINPREWDNLGIMVTSHHHYSLGDHNITTSFEDWLESQGINEKDIFSLPLYLLDHSGITMSTKPFNDPWDSMQCGVIFVTRQRIQEEYGVKKITKSIRERFTAVLESEVATYDQWLRGEVCGYERIKNDEIIDSCWGFYGFDVKENGLHEELGLKDYKMV